MIDDLLDGRDDLDKLLDQALPALAGARTPRRSRCSPSCSWRRCAGPARPTAAAARRARPREPRDAGGRRRAGGDRRPRATATPRAARGGARAPARARRDRGRRGHRRDGDRGRWTVRAPAAAEAIGGARPPRRAGGRCSSCGSSRTRLLAGRWTEPLRAPAGQGARALPADGRRGHRAGRSGGRRAGRHRGARPAGPAPHGRARTCRSPRAWRWCCRSSAAAGRAGRPPFDVVAVPEPPKGLPPGPETFVPLTRAGSVRRCPS